MSESRDLSSKMVDIFHLAERHLDKRVLVTIDRDHGFEGTLLAVSRSPPGIWLSGVDAVIFRTTLANPLPQIVSRHKKSEVFINLNSVQRIEILPSE